MALSIQMGRNIHIDEGLHFGNKPNEFLILLNRLNLLFLFPFFVVSLVNYLDLNILLKCFIFNLPIH